MSRKRERFDRSDVPTPGRYTTLKGIIVSVLSIVLAVVVVWAVYTRVERETHLDDTTLSDALDGQSDTSTPDGYTATSDDVELVLLLVADSLEEGEGHTLSSATIMVVDTTTTTITAASIPLETLVTYDDSSWTLSSLYASYGFGECIEPLASAAGVWFDHVIVSTEDVLDGLVAATESSFAETDFVTAAWDTLALLTTDASSDELLTLSTTLATVGTSNISSVSASLSAETTTDDEGNVTETGYQVLDSTSLRADLGLLVSDSAEETTEETTEETSEETTDDAA